MTTVNAAARLRAMILGIRPSLVHTSGVTVGIPVDNLTDLGIEAWRSSVTLLHGDLAALDDLDPRDRWVRDWLAVEIDRDRARWRDASSSLRLLVSVLGPSDTAQSAGQRFWVQWQRNLDHLVGGVMLGTARPTDDTQELADRCLEVATRQSAPHLALEALQTIASTPTDVGVGVGVFRPLATEVERVYLADVVSASFSATDTCRAAQERFYNPGAFDALGPCSARRVRRGGHLIGPRFRVGS